MDTVQEQNPFKSAIWPVVCLGLIIFFAVRFHASVLAWLVCSAIWTLGAVIEVIQYGKDEETLFPAVICFAAVGLMGYWMLG